MRNCFQSKKGAFLFTVALMLAAILSGCSTAAFDRVFGYKVGVRVIPVATGPDTCRIDMSVTNLREDGSVRPSFKVQVISNEEWAEIRKPFPSLSTLRPYGQMENILFEEIPAGKTGAKELATLDLPCSELHVFAFWQARSEGLVTRLPLLTPLGEPYFDNGYMEPMIAEQFSQPALVECSPSDPVCSGPVGLERVPLGHLESLNLVTEPESQRPEKSVSRPRIDLSVARTQVGEKTCEISMLVTNMTAERIISPVLKVDVGILADHFAEHPPSSPFEVNFGSIDPYTSDERVVGTVDVPCWGLDTLTFRKVCDQRREKCEDLFRLPGKPFLDRTSGVYLTVSLQNTPMYRRP